MSIGVTIITHGNVAIMICVEELTSASQEKNATTTDAQVDRTECKLYCLNSKPNLFVSAQKKIVAIPSQRIVGSIVLKDVERE